MMARIGIFATAGVFATGNFVVYVNTHFLSIVALGLAEDSQLFYVKFYILIPKITTRSVAIAKKRPVVLQVCTTYGIKGYLPLTCMLTHM